MECLIASSIAIIIFTSLSYVIFFIGKLNQQADISIKYLNDSQYLYWFFYNQITLNQGIYNLKDTDLDAQGDKNSISQFLMNKLQQPAIVQLLTKKEFIDQYRLSYYLQNKVANDSSILKVIHPSTDCRDGQQLCYLEKFFYIAHKQSVGKISFGLYQYFNHYSDELVADVTSMQVKMSKYGNKNYYYFSFSFVTPKKDLSNISNISFVLTTLDWQG